MINITLERLREWVPGTPNNAFLMQLDKNIHGVSIDTRSLIEGNVFVPFLGEQVDGHRFIDQAFAKGASVSLSEHAEDLQREVPILVVEDGLIALQTLARTYLQHVNPKVVAITGSNGKTTTKDMVECLLAPFFTVQKTIGNFNNEIGLPLTLLQLEESTEVSILEMGMDALGDIDFLSRMVEPDIAVITNVGESHIEKVGSRENIARGKFEIINGLKANGRLIYSNDYPLLSDLVSTPNINTVSVGFLEENECVITDVSETDQGTVFSLSSVHDAISIPQLGAHNAQNASVALMVAAALGIDINVAHTHFKQLKVTAMRMEQVSLPSGLIVINDAYNASAASMKSAIKSVSGLNYHNKILVLADILELGEYSEALHTSVGDFINEVAPKLHTVITYGTEAKHIYNRVYGVEKIHVPVDRFEAIIAILAPYQNPDSCILIKGSRGMALERLLDGLN